MALVFDAFSESTPGTGNQTSSHGGSTPAPRAVLVFVAILGGVDEISTCDYGGTGLTEVTGSPVVKTTGEAMTICAFFGGASLPAGTQTVTAVASATTLSKKMTVVTYTGAADTEIIDAEVVNADLTGANPRVTLSLTGRTCAAVVGFQSGHDNLVSIAPATGWTERDETDAGATTLGTYTYDTVGTTDVSAGYDAADEDGVMVAVAFSEVVAGGGTAHKQTTRRLLTRVG